MCIGDFGNMFLLLPQGQPLWLQLQLLDSCRQ
jgi:hypothetical protein